MGEEDARKQKAGRGLYRPTLEDTSIYITNLSENHIGVVRYLQVACFTKKKRKKKRQNLPLWANARLVRDSLRLCVNVLQYVPRAGTTRARTCRAFSAVPDHGIRINQADGHRHNNGIFTPCPNTFSRPGSSAQTHISSVFPSPPAQ